MASPSLKLGKITLLFFMVSVSFFGLILSILLALNPPISQPDFVWRKTIIGLSFGTVCVLGMIAVLFPNPCSRVFQKPSASISHSTSSSLRGHHPLCGRFSAHVFQLGDRFFCAACSGLFLGALIVLFATGLYFFGSLPMEQNASLMVFVGALGVVLGLLQSPLPMLQNSAIRFFTSIFFVVGTFLILAGNEELAHNTSVDFFLIVLSVFWLATRIMLSQWDHERICSNCTLETCSWKG